MQLSLTCYSLGVTLSFWKFWVENGLLIQVRYCCLLGIWCVFIVVMVFFLFLHDKIYVDMYLKISERILVQTHIRFNNIVARNVSCSSHIKYEKH